MRVVNKLCNIIRTIIIKFFYQGRITIKGHINLFRDTKLIVSGNGQIKFGNCVSTYSNVHFTAIDGKLEMGEEVSFNRNCIIVCRDTIRIGDGCKFGPNICIYDHDHCFDFDGIKKGYKTGSVVIEKNCWIGANVVILRGTHIGEGSIIGASTLVKGIIPSHSIVTCDRGLNIVPIREK